MRGVLRNPNLHLVLALVAGIGLGLTYSWKISPVTYVDASPAILQEDFKDHYRNVIAASYASMHDLPRARARLTLLGDEDVIGALSAQAQRMLASGEPFDRVRLIAQLATDLGQGYASIPFTGTPSTRLPETLPVETPFPGGPEETQTAPPPERTLSFESTPLPPPSLYTSIPRSTSTPIPVPGAPFTLVAQDTVCDPSLKPGLLQVILMDSRRRQVPGIEIILTWEGGENRFFTGLKPELGNGYADAILEPDVTYSIRVVEGGSFVPNISAPTCSEPNGNAYPGGLQLTFQQP
jgi:hypothetical protein